MSLCQVKVSHDYVGNCGDLYHGHCEAPDIHEQKYDHKYSRLGLRSGEMRSSNRLGFGEPWRCVFGH